MLKVRYTGVNESLRNREPILLAPYIWSEVVRRNPEWDKTEDRVFNGQNRSIPETEDCMQLDLVYRQPDKVDYQHICAIFLIGLVLR